MSNPYLKLTLQDFKDQDLLDELMSEEVCISGGDWSWQDFPKYIDMQRDWIDERLQEIIFQDCKSSCYNEPGMCEDCSIKADEVRKVGEQLGVY